MKINFLSLFVVVFAVFSSLSPVRFHAREEMSSINFAFNIPVVSIWANGRDFIERFNSFYNIFLTQKCVTKYFMGILWLFLACDGH